MIRDPVRAIADAVLYEGYILWPYRRSALKNQRRFTFGGVYPPAHSAAHPDDPSTIRTEVLLEAAADDTVTVDLRFLHVVTRDLLDLRTGGEIRAERLDVEGELHLAWEEAAEREVSIGPLSLDELRTGCATPIDVPGAEARETIGDASGVAAGAFVRRWQTLRGELTVRAEPLGDGLWRVCAVAANTTPWSGTDRQQALAQTFCSTHTTLRSSGGAFVSLTDPPARHAAAAGECVNAGTWPVLVGERDDRSAVLSSPIILEDHPRIAPESPGDLFDGGEIDQLLVLNILALTDAEKAEMAASDPRAREILARTEALTPEQLMALHGVVRDVGMVR